MTPADFGSGPAGADLTSPRRERAWTIRPGMLPGLLAAAIDGTSGPPRRTTRDLVVDASCVLLAAAMAMIGILLPGPGDAIDRVIAVGAAGAACGALLLRRQYPGWLSVLLITASIWLPAVSGASLIALFTAAVHRRLNVVLPLVVLAAASAVVQFRVADIPVAEGYWVAVGLAVLISFAVAGWGTAVRNRRELVLLMAERLHQVQAEQQMRVRLAHQEVRDGIARDMHDSLAHRLTLISMSAGALRYRASLPADDMREMTDIMWSNAQQALAELRQVITVLRRPDGLAVAGQHRQDQITDLVLYAREAGQSVTLDWAISADALPAMLHDTVYRLVQEGLNNARKHAKGAPVTVSGRLDGDSGLHVEVTNPVPATPATRSPGSGLIGTAERVARTGGALTVGAQDGCFRLRAHWPTAALVHHSHPPTEAP
jgi:signal transduction histidine kinase